MVMQLKTQGTARGGRSRPATPRAAACRRAALDDRLDSTLFRALGDPTRAQILACLMKCARPCLVGELAECCEVDLSVVSRHLKVLDGAGLVARRREGRTVSYLARHSALARRLRGLATEIERHAPSSGNRRPARPGAGAKGCGGADGCC